MGRVLQLQKKGKDGEPFKKKLKKARKGCQKGRVKNAKVYGKLKKGNNSTKVDIPGNLP